MKICCTYEKQYTRSYIVHYRFLVFLKRIFPHFPFTPMLAKRSFLRLFRTQRDNREKLFFSSFGEFGKICDLCCLVGPHAKIYHGLRAVSSLSGIQMKWNNWGKWRESWWCTGDLKMRSGNRTHHIRCMLSKSRQQTPLLFSVIHL